MTNAGKSTLESTDWSVDVWRKDELWQLLDPTTRALSPLMKAEKIVLTDTADLFKVSTNLIEFFKSTLVEAQEADLLLLCC